MSKRLMLQLHRWCGLAAALFILTQALTGAILLYRGEVARLIDPSGMVRHSQAGNAPLSAILGSIRREYPSLEVRRIFYPKTPTDTYFAHLAGPGGSLRYASIDPGDARILREGSIWTFPTEAALQIHYQLMSGTPGRLFVALVGLSVLGMAGTGLAYWWPRRGRWRKSLEIDLRLAPRIVLRQFHRSIGPIAAIPILLSATTGVYLAAVLLIENGPAPAPPAAAGADERAADRAVAIARAAFPGRPIRDIRLPGPTTFNILLRAPERNPEAVNLVRVDLASDAVLAKVPADQDKSLWVPILPIHDGKTFGAIGRIILLLSATLLAILAATGPIMWLQKARPAKKKKAVMRTAR